MRLRDIISARERFTETLQPLAEGDFSESVGISFALRDRESVARIAKRALALPAITVLRPFNRSRLGCELPFAIDALVLDERFADDAAWRFLLRRLPVMHKLSVLVPGCYMGGEDVQCWLRRGVNRVEGIDVYDLKRHWTTIVPALHQRWQVPVAFKHGSIESIPFADASFDVITTNGVLEHVRNLQAMVEETARVLKPGGFALHAIGPLYYSFGADHCIAAYGMQAGYDHLILTEDKYRQRIGDRTFFKEVSGNANLAFWAINDQFSFAKGKEYLDNFGKHFNISFVGAKISSEALKYKSHFGEKWTRLLDAGINESDLLLKGLTVVLQKPPVSAGDS